MLSFTSLVSYAQADTSKQLLSDGLKYLLSGDYLRVLETMTAYDKFDPQNADIYNIMALSKYYLGDLEGYCADIEQVRELGVKRNPAMYRLNCDKEYLRNTLIRHDYRGVTITEEAGFRPLYTRADSLRGALRPERTCYDVFFYDLSVRIRPLGKSITGSNQIYFKGVHPGKVIQVDLFSLYDIQCIEMNGRGLSYTREADALFIELPETIEPGKSYSLNIKYSGKPVKSPNPPWEGGFVWSHDQKLNRWVGVACEQFGASSWWPCKDHLSDRPDSMAIRIEVPRHYQAISNGRLRNTEEAGNGYIRYNWFVSYPINSYNATFYMGKYTSFTNTILCNGDTLYALYHVLPYNKEKAVGHFKQAKDVVSFYCSAFGPFPFMKDGFRMVESPYEGMEHQTAIAYGNSYSNTKGEFSYRNEEYDYIIVHETAHEWWGNSVTAADMADVWLHEGFATYAEYMFLEQMKGYDQAVEELNNRFLTILNLYPLVQHRDVNENTFVGGDIYNKGAALLQCLRATMNNDSLFRNMLHDFHLEFRDTTIRTSDFVNFVHHFTGRDYSALFDIFLYTTNLPVLSYSFEREGEDLLLKYHWTGVGEGFEMPFSIRTLNTRESIRLEASTQERETTLKNAGSFVFYNMTRNTEGIPRNGLTYYRTRCLNFE
jgi:aminopeptidase N